VEKKDMNNDKGLFRQYFLALSLVVPIAVIGGLKIASSAEQEPLLVRMKMLVIDDFSSKASNLPFRPSWMFITDQVMGGVSAGNMEKVQYQGRDALHITGNVSLENNGGFIQARTNLNPRGKTFDAGNFEGIFVQTKGNGEQYAIHLKTSDTRQPWQYYQALFQAGPSWGEIKIPFGSFKPNSLTKPLDIKALKTIAIVAINKQFEADIYVDKIGFYKEQRVYKNLTPEEKRVILHKGTERPFSGKYNNHYDQGTYTCKQCGAKLFDSTSKFKSSCGWPSFDDQIQGTVKLQPDADGMRTEILCAGCGGHLGHVFMGEGYTPKNARYCVNSISLDFDPAAVVQTETAIFASGCFWGTEYYMQKAPGVISTQVGYTGGHVDNPTYKQVCTDRTGHAEAVEVVYDPSKTTYEQLTKLYFETHDFTQLNRQGPDIGTQYRSAVFPLDEKQKEIATKLISQLKDKDYDVKTAIEPAAKFWPAEDYHQNYYEKTSKTPYCHIYRKIF
jgi:peptide methionine sulfoxide reductase msrA/msrB